LREVSVTPQGPTNLVAMAATDPKPRQAAAISNAFADRY
jgi:capsular polysaccharide biosynthesis protein